MVSPHAAAAAVVDPELPPVTIEELGILRDVTVDGTGRVTVTITPTYSGCPALDMIRAEIVAALDRAGYPDADVVTNLSPPWSTDQITESGRRKLAVAGIAPPTVAAPGASPGELARSPGPTLLQIRPRCPSCGSPDTQELSRFGSTACKALWRCRACAEPFDAVKPL
jgi:ring-1,2-phenylacetyl-CoA epoxidase subunit PaaD